MNFLFLRSILYAVYEIFALFCGVIILHVLCAYGLFHIMMSFWYKQELSMETDVTIHVEH